MTNVTSPTNQSPTAQNNPTEPDSGSKSGMSDDDIMMSILNLLRRWDKIEVLASEAVSFYREFTDLDREWSINLYTSIVVAVNQQKALRNISADQLELKTAEQETGIKET